MPLLISPIDGSPMRQIHRYGIEIDVCPTSGGIWLDRGELEKLMALLKEDARNEPPVPARDYAPSGRYRDDEDDHRDERGHDRYRKKSKKSWIADIFDFD